MGVRLRKSINLGGGFRINLSKSGVGYSWGVPGYRITKTAAGKTRKTYSVPGTGISYVEEQGKKTSSAKPASPASDNNSNYSAVKTVESADIENFKPAEHRELLNQIETIILLNKATTWILIVSFIMSASLPIFWLLFILSGAVKIYLHTKGRIYMDYDMDQESANEFAAKAECWKSLNKCKKLWHISQEAKINNKKYAGGAGRNIQRQPFTITHNLPFYLRINIQPVVLKLNKETLIFLPDKLLIIKKGNAGAVNYSSITYDVYAAGMLEVEKPPKDAQFIQKVWLKTNKDGSPDKRFKNNRQVPVYKYGHIDISSPEGLNAKLICSNERIVENFKTAMRV